MQAEQLMSELAWLRRLARALVRDASDADDLVQDTWLAAASHAPDDDRPVKPWLTRVALNVVRMRGRAAKRRATREAAVEPARAPTPDELVSRVEAQRIVVDEVLRLAEPYRSTVLLHYFEDLSSAEIARRLGLPDGTVRRRLKAGLDELRGRLRAEERATGRCVLAALAPLALGRSASTALGILAMKKIVAIVVLVVVSLFFAASRLHHAPAAPAPAVARAPVPAAAPLAHPAPTPARVTIQVSDTAGPVAGATVRCAPADGEVIVVQARDGTAVVELAAGTWSIAASADGHEPAATKLEAAGGASQVSLVLALGGRTLSGTVTDATGGAIAGARIDAARIDSRARPGRAVAVAFTDADGHYKLAIGAGQLFVAASHPEYAPQTRYVDLGPSGAAASFSLVPGAAIEGVVRDASGKQPVPGAAVRARHASASLELAEAGERVVKADADGKFRLAGLRPGAYELSARDGNRATRAPVRIGLGVAEQLADVVVLVGATASIRGTVVDDAGATVAGVTVTARNESGDSDTAVSDRSGRFALDGLAPSRWTLRGASDQHLAQGNASVELVSRDVDGVVVHVRRGRELRGHVEPRGVCDVLLAKDERGEMMMRNDEVTTDEHGEFRFAPLAAGTAKLSARCQNGDEGAVTAAVDGAEHVIAVAPGGSIAGRVVDGGGAAVAGVTVSAEAVSDVMITTIVDGAVTSGVKAVTDASGAFEIRGLAAGRWQLRVLDRGRPMKTKKRVEPVLAAGQHATGVELVVDRPAGTIRGTVTGPDGAPVADAWVTLRQTLRDQVEAMALDDRPQGILVQNEGNRDAVPPALTDARGRFELGGVPRGRYQVFAEAQAGKLHGGAADVTPDADVTIRLAGVSALRGTVRGARGPSELFTVELVGPTADRRSFTDGAFEFPRVDPGDYTITVTSSDGVGKGTAHVAPAGDASVDIVLVANATVTGRLVDATGAPLPGVEVTLVEEQPPDRLNFQMREQPLASGPDGRFAVVGDAGKRMLVVLGRRPTIKRGLVLEAGKPLDIGDVTVDEQR